MTNLTPYDSGSVLIPQTWLSAHSGVTADNLDEFGRVDFDTPEGASLIAGLRVLPDPIQDGAVIIEFGGAEMVTIRCTEPGARISLETATGAEDLSTRVYDALMAAGKRALADEYAASKGA